MALLAFREDTYKKIDRLSAAALTGLLRTSLEVDRRLAFLHAEEISKLDLDRDSFCLS